MTTEPIHTPRNLAADETATLLERLDGLRSYIEWKCGGLDAEQMRATLGPSTMTLGGLVKHLALVESDHFARLLLRGGPGEPWESVDWDADPDWEWRTAADDTPEELWALWHAAVDRSRAQVADAVADGGMDHLGAYTTDDGRSPNLRRVVLDMVEEYARHLGHADLIRESIDGLVGEDPVMTPDDAATPWEPPLAGTEVEHLFGALDRLRWTFRWKAADLDAAGLSTRIASSTLTLGGLLKHLAAIEDHKTTRSLSGAPMHPTWEVNGWDGDDDWEFASAGDDSPDVLYALYDGAVERARTRFVAAVTDGGLGQEIHLADDSGTHASLRRLVFDLVEEYGRHTGHADLLREAVDGRAGEDPPPGWRP